MAFAVNKIGRVVADETHVKPTMATPLPRLRQSGVSATTSLRAEFEASVLSLLDFMEEKLGEALQDETSRIAAIAEAAGALPTLRDRLRKNELAQTKFMLVFGNELHEPHATERWRDLARMPRSDFEAEVEAFLKPGGTFAELRAIVGTS